MLVIMFLFVVKYTTFFFFSLCYHFEHILLASNDKGPLLARVLCSFTFPYLTINMNLMFYVIHLDGQEFLFVQQKISETFCNGCTQSVLPSHPEIMSVLSLCM